MQDLAFSAHAPIGRIVHVLGILGRTKTRGPRGGPFRLEGWDP